MRLAGVVLFCKSKPPSLSLSLCLSYQTDSGTDFPSLVVDDYEVTLSHPPDCALLSVELVQCEASDGTPLCAYLHSHVHARPDTPLLVHVHGGPAVSWPMRRLDSAGATRYPYRHLLFAGYKVLTPMFRGTLGFGDAFAAGNIREQGKADLDDIVSCIDATVAQGLVAKDAYTGIFGGSYGGYMTLRALHTLPERFKVGVAEYGFLSSRWMSLEGGDLTWEREYVGNITWPLKESDTESDTYLKLHNIRAPTLLLHGEKDDICPLSQSLVAYRTLQSVRARAPCCCDSHALCRWPCPPG